ncbi:MAG: hypothetical protein FJX73_07865 [Armatimonadetes bacterium]|nr:hypothetical protein [Armatimonadota bacterium]
MYTPFPGTGFVLVHGDPACLTVGLLLGLRAATPASPLLIVDGANALNPYLLTGLARRMGRRPEALLASVFISRVFTAYQLEAAVVDRLEGAVAARRSSGVLIAGLLDPLHDEDLSTAEARRIFQRVLATLTRLAARQHPLVVAAPPQPPVRGREGFGVQIAAAADWVFRASCREGRIEIAGEKPSPGRWWWEPEVPLLAARRWC